MHCLSSASASFAFSQGNNQIWSRAVYVYFSIHIERVKDTAWCAPTLLNNYQARGDFYHRLSRSVCATLESCFGAGDIFDANTAMGTKLSGRKDNGPGSRERSCVINSTLSYVNYRRDQQKQEKFQEFGNQQKTEWQIAPWFPHWFKISRLQTQQSCKYREIEI